MKKREFAKSLTLHRETLLALEDSELQKALIAGAAVTSACKSGWTCCQSTC